MASAADHARFILNFLRHPITTGAVAPSSHWLANRMADEMELEKASTVVEVGPGTGPVTRAIVGRIPAEALFLAIELNAEFARKLAERFPRAEVINDSAENISLHLAKHGRRDVDSVLSSLPWASFPVELQERLLGAITGSLKPGGRFATFAYVHASWFPTARRFRELLESRFGTVRATRVVWRNLPPALVYRCEK